MTNRPEIIQEDDGQEITSPTPDLNDSQASDLGDLQETVNQLQDVIPSMNVNMPMPVEPPPELVPDEALIGLWNKILDVNEKSCQELDGYIDHFANLVMNDGDVTTSSKEALVALLVQKANMVGNPLKVAEQMLRGKMKNTFPAYMAKQTNNINIQPVSRRQLLQNINKENQSNGS